MSTLLQEAYNRTAAHADTATQGIGASETSRVLATFFKVLVQMSAADACTVIGQGVQLAAEKLYREGKDKKVAKSKKQRRAT